jgi:hypothetical protein
VVAAGVTPIATCAEPPTATTLKTLDCTEKADDVVAAPAVNVKEEFTPTGL